MDKFLKLFDHLILIIDEIVGFEHACTNVPQSIEGVKGIEYLHSAHGVSKCAI